MPNLEHLPPTSENTPPEPESIPSENTPAPDNAIHNIDEFVHIYQEDPTRAIDEALAYLTKKFEHVEKGGPHWGIAEFNKTIKGKEDDLLFKLLDSIPDNDPEISEAFTNLMQGEHLSDAAAGAIKERLQLLFEVNKKTLH